MLSAILVKKSLFYDVCQPKMGARFRKYFCYRYLECVEGKFLFALAIALLGSQTLGFDSVQIAKTFNPIFNFSPPHRKECIPSSKNLDKKSTHEIRMEAGYQEDGCTFDISPEIKKVHVNLSIILKGTADGSQIDWCISKNIIFPFISYL